MKIMWPIYFGILWISVGNACLSQRANPDFKFYTRDVPCWEYGIADYPHLPKYKNWNCVSIQGSLRYKCINLKTMVDADMMNAVILEGWAKMHVFENTKCIGKGKTITKANTCKKLGGYDHEIMRGCYEGPFLSLAGPDYIIIPDSFESDEEIIKHCTPSEELSIIDGYNNTKGMVPINLTHSYEVFTGETIVNQNSSNTGGSTSTSNTQEHGQSSSITKSTGKGTNFGSIPQFYNAIMNIQTTQTLHSKFSSTFSSSSSFGYQWSESLLANTYKRTTKTITTVVPPGAGVKIKQLVGTCGKFAIFTNSFHQVNYDKNGKQYEAPFEF